MTKDVLEASQALEAMNLARGRLAAAADCPPERHLLFAALMGGLVAIQAAPTTAILALEPLFLLAVVLIVRWDRKRTGMFINGYRNGRTRPVAFTMLGMTLALLALGIWLKDSRGLAWAPLACGAVAFVVAYLGSRWWQSVFRRELNGAS
jgi:hypothetical protein